MPASRSRTQNWKRSLQQIHERGGALEITLPRYIADNGDLLPDNNRKTPADIIWRVRILGLRDDAIIVEQPSVLGQTIKLDDGIEIAGIITVGQNRWMFVSQVEAREPVTLAGKREVTALRVTMPDEVERCQRRQFYRVSTVGVQLAGVTCYPLLDPITAPPAEALSRQEIIRRLDTPVAGRIDASLDEAMLPVVGPEFPASLMNVGGGGVGLLVEPEHRSALEAARMLWLRIDLTPEVPAPLGVSARLRHTHIDSAQRVYAGVSFEFGLHPEHQQFVVDQICRYVALVQREQLARARKQGQPSTGT